MHGQKKRRKRLLDGLIAVQGVELSWELMSEPQWSTEHGYKGLCISVRTEDESHRELILEYGYPTNEHGSPLPLPQRPTVSEKAIEADVQQAMTDGWTPLSRGKTLVHRIV